MWLALRLVLPAVDGAVALALVAVQPPTWHLAGGRLPTTPLDFHLVHLGVAWRPLHPVRQGFGWRNEALGTEGLNAVPHELGRILPGYGGRGAARHRPKAGRHIHRRYNNPLRSFAHGRHSPCAYRPCPYVKLRISHETAWPFPTIRGSMRMAKREGPKQLPGASPDN
jgi:hypothetical protein